MGGGGHAGAEARGGSWPHVALGCAVLAAGLWLGLCAPFPGDTAEFPPGTWLETATNVEIKGNYLCATLQRRDRSPVEDCVLSTVGYTFENIDGNLQATDNMDNLPGGTWDDTARNVSMKGNLLCAYLRIDVYEGPTHKYDWVYNCIVAKEGFYYANVNGSFRVRTSACDSLPQCVEGYTHRPGLADRYCLYLFCDAVLDRDICCERSMPCANISFCEFGYVQDPNGYCFGAECTPEDVEKCCVRAAQCRSMECPFGYALKPNSRNRFCPDDECVVLRDYEHCCEYAHPCDGLNGTDCPLGFLFNFSKYCDGAFCDEERDRMRCCQEVESCSALECPYGTLLKPIMNNSSPFCLGDPCDVLRDTEACCHDAAPCSNLTCPLGLTQKSGDRYCAHYVFDGCELEDDTATCCRGAAPCAELGSPLCPHGYFFNYDDFCDGFYCEEDRDRMVCCQVAEPCSEYGDCPIYLWEGYNLRPNPHDTYCNGNPCDFIRDRDFCCEESMKCASLACPVGYVHRPNITENGTQGMFCSSPVCSVAADRDICCEPAEPCATGYTCPFGYSPTAGAFCGAVLCEEPRDLDACCDPSMPCENLTCPIEYGFVNIPRVFCAEIYCEFDVDKDTCCAKGIHFKYYRFVWRRVRHVTNDEAVAFAEIDFYYSGDSLDLTDVEAEAPGGNYPYNEYPGLVLDRDVWSKFLDFDQTPLVITFPETVSVDSWAFMTANDFPERDPVEWTVEASRDGVFWVAIQDGDFEAQIPEERYTWSPALAFDIPCKSPFGDNYQMVIGGQPAESCVEGAWVAHGAVCTTQCSDGFTPSVATLSCSQGYLVPANFDCN